MMPTPNYASFQAPPDYAPDLAAIQRAQTLAQALQTQASQPLPNEVASGGLQVPTSPMLGIAKLAQALIANRTQTQADQQMRDLTQRVGDQRAQLIARMLQAAQGTPGKTVEGINPNPDQMGPGAPVQQPGSPPNFGQGAMLGIGSNDPIGQQLGLEMYKRAQSQQAMQQFMQQFGGGRTGQPGATMGAGTPAQAGPGPGGAPMGGSPFPGVSPAAMGAMASGDSTLQTLAKMLQSGHEKMITPTRVSPGGIAVTPDGRIIASAPQNGIQNQYSPDGIATAAPVPGYAPALAQNATATAAGQAYGKLPYEPPATYNTPGAPTAATPIQSITAATGSPPPTPAAVLGGMVPGAVTPTPTPQPATGDVQIPPQVQASRDQTRLAILQDELTRNPNDQSLKAEIARMGTPGRLPGIPLQDQGESAQQRSYGTQRGQLEAEKPVATLAMNDAASNLDRLAQQADALKNHQGISRITGIPGMIPNIPGLAGADAQAKLDTLKSQAAFTVLQAMRNASKSGGALGQVSDREELMLANNLAALQNSQSTQALQDNLQRIVDWARGAKARMQNAYDMTYKGAAPAAPAGGPLAPDSSIDDLVKKYAR